MKLKLAITYGILEWGLIYLITVILNHFITDDLPYIDITIPLSIIIGWILADVTGIVYYLICNKRREAYE